MLKKCLCLHLDQTVLSISLKVNNMWWKLLIIVLLLTQGTYDKNIDLECEFSELLIYVSNCTYTTGSRECASLLVRRKSAQLDREWICVINIMPRSKKLTGVNVGTIVSVRERKYYFITFIFFRSSRSTKSDVSRR